MPLIKLHKANEAGEDTGVIVVNTDQIVVITTGKNATELQMVDGRTRWVRDSFDEILSLTKAAASGG